MIEIAVFVLASFLSYDTIPTISMKVGQSETEAIVPNTCFGCGDCSVYCAIEGEYTLTTSSHLGPQSKNSYSVKQLDDYNLQTAWVEGKADYGVGEWFEFKFDKQDFSGTAIALNGLYLFNGYRKSLKHWQENARIKTLKMIVDEQDYAFLALSDTYKFQSAHFEEIKLNKNTTVQFQIIEVYPGSKYQDVALSELKFQGIHHH